MEDFFTQVLANLYVKYKAKSTLFYHSNRFSISPICVSLGCCTVFTFCNKAVAFCNKKAVAFCNKVLSQFVIK